MERNFTNREINKAGEILKDQTNYSFDDIVWAEDVLTYWRIIHGYVINTFQATLREKVKLFHKERIIAQRLKRTPSIIYKLQRFDKMQLSRMQDIAGIRAVLKNIEEVRKLEKSYKNSQFKHKLRNEKDYIQNPKESGYRSIHLVYEYSKDNIPCYHGLQIELQIRTKLEHTWATAVETIGTYLNYALKSSVGPKQWLDFFAMSSSAFAYLENSPRIPGYEHFTEKDIFEMVVQKFDDLGVKDKLQAFSIATKHINRSTKYNKYNLIILDLAAKNVSVRNFAEKDFNLANEQYTETEKRISAGAPLQVVLVSTGSIDSLRRAYPNYFLDTQEFLQKIELLRHRKDRI